MNQNLSLQERLYRVIHIENYIWYNRTVSKMAIITRNIEFLNEPKQIYFKTLVAK